MEEAWRELAGAVPETYPGTSPVARHAVTQADGRDRWYEAYTVHVARVERAYGWTRPVTRD